MWANRSFLLSLLRDRPQCGDARAQQRNFVVGGQNLKREALQRAHLDHGFDVSAQPGQLEEADVVAGEVEAAGAGEVDERGGGGGQRAVPQVDKLAAALVALFRLGKDLFRLQVQEAHAHGAIAHDAFQMSNAAAAAVALLGIEA